MRGYMFTNDDQVTDLAPFSANSSADPLTLLNTEREALCSEG